MRTNLEQSPFVPAQVSRRTRLKLVLGVRDYRRKTFENEERCNDGFESDDYWLGHSLGMAIADRRIP